jgi:hypothetical protein
MTEVQTDKIEQVSEKLKTLSPERLEAMIGC